MQKSKLYTHTHTDNGILFGHKKKEILLFAITEMDLKGIILLNKSEKHKYYKISFICGVLKEQSYRSRVGCQG